VVTRRKKIAFAACGTLKQQLQVRFNLLDKWPPVKSTANTHRLPPAGPELYAGGRGTWDWQTALAVGAVFACTGYNRYVADLQERGLSS
ncbi:MAG: hypothetical protein AAB658_16820, partial [Chloroflexota bacterium]